MRRLLLFFMLLAAGMAQIQSTLPNVGAAYEGETVTSIDVVANPHLDVAPFTALIVQRTGQPYSEKKVEASVAALQGSGKFPKVRTMVTPEPKGLRLTFILEPAYYVGIIDFPEAAKHFSYIRLLQVVNYSDENPYDQSALPTAETALQTFLKENGYFQSQVHATTSLDDAHQLANITFHVTMGRRARIGTVTIAGPTSAEDARLLHAVRSLRARFSGGLLKPGKTYSAGRMKDATLQIKRSLASQHYLASKVRFQPPQYHPETNRADISFQVDPGPLVLIRVTGAKLAALPFMSRRQEKKLIPVYSEGTIDRDLVNEGQQNLIDYFQKKGYFDVQVKTIFEKQPGEFSLTYQIDKGKKHKVDKIIFAGNRTLSESNLLDHIPLKKSHIWTHGAYSAKLLKTSVTNIEALYRDAGFEDVKVSPKVVDRELKIEIKFNIDEGRRTLVENISVTGNKSISYKALAGKTGFQLAAGAPFSPGKMASDRNRITATYLDQGYLNAEVKAMLRRYPGDSHKVDITYQITENQKVRIKEVLYQGQKHTRLSLLRKTSGLTAETPLSEKGLLESETRLYNLDIFDWASVGPKKPITDQTDEEAVVKVHEAKRTEIIYGFGFEIEHRGGNIPSGSVPVPGLPPVNIGNNQIAPSQALYASPRGSIELLRHNMRGMDETASLSLLASRLDQRALASYTDPHFRETNWDALTSFSFERTTENPLFGANLTDGSFQLQRVLNKKTNTQLQVRYDFNHTTLSDLLVPELVLPRDRDVQLSTLSTALIRDTRDKPLDAHKGSYTTINFGITPTALGSSANFNRLFAQYAFYQPVHGMVWANSIRLGLDKAFAGSFVPTSQLFFAGGGTTLRGFPIDEAGPQRIVPFCNVLQGNSGCVNVTVPVGGRQLFILNSELRFPLKIVPALGGVVFYDGGNVYSAINFNQFVNNYSNTVGFGLRYSTPIGPIRIDIGRNLNPVPGIGATQYFITLGQAF
jgi:outer membrane protein insertion porin family